MTQKNKICFDDIISRLRQSNPFPEDIFIEPTREQYALMHNLLQEAGLSLDKFAGVIARRTWNQCVKELEKLFAEY